MYTHEERRQLLKLGAVSAEPVKYDLGHIRVGRLPTVNQDDYPGLGDYLVQLRIGQEGEEVLARVYGNTPEQAHNRAAALAAQAQPPVSHATTDERKALESAAMTLALISSFGGTRDMKTIKSIRETARYAHANARAAIDAARKEKGA